MCIVALPYRNGADLPEQSIVDDVEDAVQIPIELLCTYMLRIKTLLLEVEQLVSCVAAEVCNEIYVLRDVFRKKESIDDVLILSNTKLRRRPPNFFEMAPKI